MGFPAPSPEELEAHHKQLAESDAKINASKLEIARLEKEAIRPLQPLAFLLPRPVEKWLGRLLTSREVGESVQKAQVEHEWLVFDRTCSRRPLYPRPRAISFTKKSSRKGSTQAYFMQSQSPLYALLPVEIRTAIYCQVLSGLMFEIWAFVCAGNGPKGSEDRTCFQESRIEDAANSDRYWQSGGYGGFPGRKEHGLKPWILPLLQTCRRIYTEAIPILYTSNIFKTTRHHYAIYFPKYLLTQRLHSIRTFHCTLQLGYPWHVQRLPLQALAQLRGLRRLRIDGVIDSGLVDSKKMEIISRELWKEKRGEIVPWVRKLDFVQDVDVYLPILEADLGNDVRIGKHCRVHGIASASEK